MRHSSPIIRSLAPLLLLASTALGGCSEAADARLNVLLVTLDTTRADRLGCYGYGGETTPHLDALAGEGVRFEHAVSTAGITPMAHASILTGLNTFGHGLRVFEGGAGNRLADGVPTLASLLAEWGWKTAATVSAYTVVRDYGLARGFGSFDQGDIRLGGRQRGPGQAAHKEIGVWNDARQSRLQRRADATTDQVLAWLDAEGKSGPWLHWVHYFDVHDYSLVPPAAFAAEHGVVYRPEVERNDPEAMEILYDLELRYVDAQLARLFERLREQGLWERTVVVVLADHGQGLRDGLERHGWLRHRLIYEWSIRVPLLVRLPGWEGAAVVPDLVRCVDVLPTLLEALALPVPEDLAGRSLLGLMRGREEPGRIAFAEALNLLDDFSPNRQLPERCRDNLFSVSDGRWKLIHHREQPDRSELYDLSADPGETENVFSAQPAEAERLRRLLVETGALDLQRLAGDDMGELPAGHADEMGQTGYAGDSGDADTEEQP